MARPGPDLAAVKERREAASDAFKRAHDVLLGVALGISPALYFAARTWANAVASRDGEAWFELLGTRGFDNEDFQAAARTLREAKLHRDLAILESKRLGEGASS